jgi:hypothetical protein
VNHKGKECAGRLNSYLLDGQAVVLVERRYAEPSTIRDAFLA